MLWISTICPWMVRTQPIYTILTPYTLSDFKIEQENSQ